MGTGKLPGRKLPHTPSQKIVLRKITPENIIPRKKVHRKLSLKKLPPINYPPLVSVTPLKINFTEKCPHRRFSSKKLTLLKAVPQKITHLHSPKKTLHNKTTPKILSPRDIAL